MIIDRTAELAFLNDTPENKIHRLAFATGAAVVLDAFEHADISSFKIEYVKNVFTYSGLPVEFKNQDADILREQIEFSSLIGHASHPELQHITNLTSKYYNEKAPYPTMERPVILGVGRMAFILDKCFASLRIIDPIYDIELTLDETDWSKIEPEDIIGKNA